MKTLNKAVFWLSYLSLFLINLTRSQHDTVVSAAVVILLLPLVLKLGLFKRLGLRSLFKQRALCLFSAVTALMLGLRHLHWHAFIIFGSKPPSYERRFALSASFSLLLMLGSFLFISVLIQGVSERISDKKADSSPPKKAALTKAEVLLCAVTALCCITICSQSSPLYPFNVWDDVSCFFTVGKAVTNGTVMYRDIYEQKGPLLYFLHTLAYIISRDTYFGAYLSELAASFSFLLISLKTAKLFDVKHSPYFIPVIGAVVYSSLSMFHGGSAEELMLPLLALSLYIGLRAVRELRAPSPVEWFAVGAAAACVMWIKFSVLGFYIGFGLFFAVFYIKNKWFGKIAASVLALVGGIAAASVPILLYFAVNGALGDMFKVYFYDNLFMYTVGGSDSGIISVLDNIRSGSGTFFKNFPSCVVLMAAGGIYLLGDKKNELVFSISTAAFMFLLIYSGGRDYSYYSLVFAVYIPVGLMILPVIAQMILHKEPTAPPKKYAVPICAGVWAVCMAVTYILSPNTYLMRYEKSDLPQYRFDEIISQKSGATLLNYGFLDGGFYTVSRVMPTCRYFCGLNIQNSEVSLGQDMCVNSGEVDFVVTRDMTLSEEQLDIYELVSEAQFETEKGNERTFYLYRKK